MNKIKIFIKKDCPLCPGAKEVGQKLIDSGREIEYFDIDTDTGLAEASFYTVLSTPTIIISNSGGNEIYSWRGQIPSIKNILEKC